MLRSCSPEQDVDMGLDWAVGSIPYAYHRRGADEQEHPAGDAGPLLQGQ